MERKENVFEKELKEVNINLEDAKKMEAYYDLIGETGVRAENTSFERIKNEKLVKYLSGLKDLPSILDIRFASHAKLDQIREEKRQSLLDEEYAIEQDMDRVKGKLKELEKKEKSLTNKKDEDEKVNSGQKINLDIYEAKKFLADLHSKRDVVRKKMKDLESLDYEALRSILIGAIDYSSITMSLEEEIKNKAKSFKLFEKVSDDPEKVRNLAYMMMSLHKYSVETYPTHPKYPKQTYLKLDVPKAFIEDIFENSNVYSATSETICDIGLAVELTKEFLSNYNFDKKEFDEYLYKVILKGAFAFSNLLEYLRIQDKKEKGSFYHTDAEEEEELIKYFSEDHYDLIQSLIRRFSMVDGEELEEKNGKLLSKLGTISVKLSECSKGYFNRKTIKKLKEELYLPQIEMFKILWEFLKKKYDNLDIIGNNATLEDLVCQFDDPNDPDFPELLDETKEGIEKTYKTISDVHQKFLTLQKDRAAALKDYDERLAKKIEEIKKFAFVKHCDKELLLTNLNGDDLINYIYENAAISAMFEPINEAEKIAREASFDEEAEIRNMSPAELHFAKLKEERNRIALEFSKKVIEETASAAEPKTKTLKNNFLDGLDAYINEDIDD